MMTTNQSCTTSAWPIVDPPNELKLVGWSFASWLGDGGRYVVSTELLLYLPTGQFCPKIIYYNKYVHHAYDLC